MKPFLVVANKGTGAGGANTNLYGKSFETLTNNKERLLTQGFVQCKIGKSKSTYLTKIMGDKTIQFVVQGALKQYMKTKHNITMFRNPDEAYIILTSGKSILKILEKKEQRVEGSVETKLWSGPSLQREYQLVLGDKFEVHYAYCVNDFLKKKVTSLVVNKYMYLNTILQESNVPILFGQDENYFETLDAWIYDRE